MLQERLFENERASNARRSFQGASPASRTALQESVWRLLMSVIYGASLQGSFARLTPNGLWERTCRGYSQVSMDGSLDAFCGTWSAWGIVSDGAAILPHGLEPCIDESGFSLLPTPVAFDSRGMLKNLRKSADVQTFRSVTITQVCYILSGFKIHPHFIEAMMGFPLGWTELEA